MLLAQASSAFIPVVFVILAIALRGARVYARRTKRSPDFGVDGHASPPAAERNDVPGLRRTTPTASTYPATPNPPVTYRAPTSPAATPPVTPVAPTGSADPDQFGTPDFGPPLDFGPMPDTPAS